jgi:NDP-sugar pyrophosphorylase family protein
MNHASDLFNLDNLEHPELFVGTYPWTPTVRLMDYLQTHAREAVAGELHPAAIVEGSVTIGAASKIDAGSVVRGATLIGRECFVGGALVRDSIIESGALIGNGCEIARSIIMRGAKIYHNSVVLDSIVGRDVSIGGGTLLGNTNINDSTVHVVWSEKRVDTGLPRLGAIVGDGCRFGMGCLIYPGAMLGKNSVIGAGVHLIGSHPPHSYVKALQTIRSVVRRPGRNSRGLDVGE